MEEVTDLWHRLSVGGGAQAFVLLALMIQLLTVSYAFIQYIQFGSYLTSLLFHPFTKLPNKCLPVSNLFVVRIQLLCFSFHQAHICFNLFSHLFHLSASLTPVQPYLCFPPFFHAASFGGLQKRPMQEKIPTFSDNFIYLVWWKLYRQNKKARH